MSNTTLEVTLDLGEFGEHEFIAEGTYSRGYAGRDTLANGDPGYPSEPDSFELEYLYLSNGGSRRDNINFTSMATSVIEKMLLQAAREVNE